MITSASTSKAWEAFIKIHGVAFTKAGTVFGDDLAITVPDPDHSDDKDRYITIGWSHRGRLLMVAHTDRDDKIRHRR